MNFFAKLTGDDVCLAVTSRRAYPVPKPGNLSLYAQHITRDFTRIWHFHPYRKGPARLQKIHPVKYRLQGKRTFDKHSDFRHLETASRVSTCRINFGLNKCYEPIQHATDTCRTVSQAQYSVENIGNDLDYMYLRTTKTA